MAKKQKADHKFGVAQLAKALGIELPSVRVALRKKGIKKTKEGVYGWDSQKDFDAVVSKLKADTKKSAPPKKKAPAKK